MRQRRRAVQPLLAVLMCCCIVVVIRVMLCKSITDKGDKAATTEQLQELISKVDKLNDVAGERLKVQRGLESRLHSVEQQLKIARKREGAEMAKAFSRGSGTVDTSFESECSVSDHSISRCMYPFTLNGATIKNCSVIPGTTEPRCATEIDVSSGEPTNIETCSPCPSHDGFVTGKCAAGEVCSCAEGIELRCGVIHGTLPCELVCKALVTDYPSRDTWESAATEAASFIFNSWSSQPPGTENPRMFDSPNWETFTKSVKHQWKEKSMGIAISSGNERMLSAVTNAFFIRSHLKSNLPIEIWREGTEASPTPTMEERCLTHRIFHRAIPAQYGFEKFHWEKRWKKGEAPVLGENQVGVALKPLVALLSSFDYVIFLDDDAIPAFDPLILLNSFLETQLSDSAITAIFFRDIWSLWKDASIWNHLPWPGAEKGYSPSQDSGVFLVCKSCDSGKGFKGLITAGYLNFYHEVYYKAIYLGGFKTNSEGFDAIGVGDKDTFQVGWITADTKYRMMGPVVFVGRENEFCGATLGQPYNDDGIIGFLHVNGHKLKWSDFIEGNFASWGLSTVGLEFLHRIRRPKTVNRYDGRYRTQITWKNKTRGDTHCLAWHRQIYEPLKSNIGWDIKEAYNKHIMTSFGLWWYQEYMNSIVKD